jgi:hypothetical protein
LIFLSSLRLLQTPPPPIFWLKYMPGSVPLLFYNVSSLPVRWLLPAWTPTGPTLLTTVSPFLPRSLASPVYASPGRQPMVSCSS